MEPSRHILHIEYKDEFTTTEKKDELYERDIANAYTEKIPGRIKEFNEKIARYNTELEGFKNRITKIKEGDTTARKVGRVFVRGAMAASIILGIVTLVPMVAILIASVANKKFGDGLAKYWNRAFSPLTPSLALDEKDQLRILKNKIRKEVPFNPLDMRVKLSYQSMTSENNYSNNYTFEQVKEIYERDHKGIQGLDLKEKEVFQEQISDLNGRIKYEPGGLFAKY